MLFGPSPDKNRARDIECSSADADSCGRWSLITPRLCNDILGLAVTFRVMSIVVYVRSEQFCDVIQDDCGVDLLTRCTARRQRHNALLANRLHDSCQGCRGVAQIRRPAAKFTSAKMVPSDGGGSVRCGRHVSTRHQNLPS